MQLNLHKMETSSIWSSQTWQYQTVHTVSIKWTWRCRSYLNRLHGTLILCSSQLRSPKSACSPLNVQTAWPRRSTKQPIQSGMPCLVAIRQLNGLTFMTRRTPSSKPSISEVTLFRQSSSSCLASSTEKLLSRRLSFKLRSSKVQKLGKTLSLTTLDS